MESRLPPSRTHELHETDAGPPPSSCHGGIASEGLQHKSRPSVSTEEINGEVLQQFYGTVPPSGGDAQPVAEGKRRKSEQGPCRDAKV